ncbi:GNAT family N-acetyltransferase [Adhaeribacter radiodurans]|uniref:GNAT family N-acetyltransferase n=1 Tax=Adhaeribacter radiodurans TaxID=2745197 RepID=A0A7L7LF50_9BACT|nr:GNAT family N-acetyltransferase [Adhaeribacter radiodurans]QMU31314.1 GNAT family N-acetyltransferase [Adhaeribacter radiodurans]
MHDEYVQGAFTISTNPAKLQVEVIHRYLTEDSYWAQNISRALVEKSIQHSFNFGVYYHQEQVGFARVVTDYATFALLCDVFILPAYRGKGLSKWLVSVIVAHPELQGLRRFSLYTKDAHSLYATYGFQQIADPTRAMEIKNSNPYQS